MTQTNDNHPDQPNGINNTPLIRSGIIRACLYFVTIMIVILVSSIILAIVLGITKMPEDYLNDSKFLMITVITTILAVIITYIFRKLIDRQSFKSLGFAFDKVTTYDLISGVFTGIIILGLVFVILALIGSVEFHGFRNLSIGQFLMGFFAFIVVSLDEELINRGYILNNFMQSLNKYTSLIIVSIIFALSHSLNPNVSLLSILNIFLAGILLGIYYVHRQNLWFPIGLHFSWNFCQGVIFSSQVSGVQGKGLLDVAYVGNDLLTGGEFGFEGSLVTTFVTIVAIFALHFLYRMKTK